MDEYQMEFATGFGESYQNCPACGKEMVAGHSECFSCGVVVNRFQDRQQTQLTKSNIGGIEHLTSFDIKKLDKRWKKVVVNYHDQQGHQEFLQACQENGALAFAIYHYSKMMEIDKEDDIAQLMRRQALSRLTVSTEVSDSKHPEAFEHLDILVRLTIYLLMVCSVALILMGVLSPNARNLVGLGVASLSFFIALYLYRRN